MKDSTQQILKWTVVGGSALLAVNEIVKLTKTKSLKEGIVPVIYLLVGISAFSYAMTAEKVSFIPKTSGVDGEDNSNYLSCETRGGLGGTTSRCPKGEWCVRGVCQSKTDTKL